MDEQRRYVRHTCVPTPPLGGARAVAFLDLENLLHPVRSAGWAAVQSGLHAVVDQVAPLASRLFVTACCDFWLAEGAVPAAAARKVRLHSGPLGKDRADGELARRMLDIPATADVVVIGSGDRFFAPLARRLRAEGLRVVVLAEPQKTSGVLARSADAVMALRLPTPTAWGPQLTDCDCADSAA